MAYSVYLRVEHPNGVMGNVRLDMWLTKDGDQVGENLKDVGNPNIETGVGEKPLNAIDTPNVLVGNYIVIVDEMLFGLAHDDRVDFLNNPTDHKLNLRLFESEYVIEHHDISLTAEGGLPLELDTSNPQPYSTKEPVPYLLALEADTEPPSQVLKFSAAPHDGKVVLTWETPSDVDYTGVLIKRRTTGKVETPTDGEAVDVGFFTIDIADNGKVIQQAHNDTDVINETLYYYRAFAYDDNKNYKLEPVTEDEAKPLDDYVPRVPQPVSEGINGKINIRWQEPDDPENDILGYMILRSADDDPNFPDLAPVRGVVYEVDDVLGNASIVMRSLKGDILLQEGDYKFIDSGLVNDTKYKYTIYGYDEVSNYYNHALLPSHEGKDQYKNGTPFEGTPLALPKIVNAVTKGTFVLRVIFDRNMSYARSHLSKHAAYEIDKELVVDDNHPVTFMKTNTDDDTVVIHTAKQASGEVYTVTVK